MAITEVLVIALIFSSSIILYVIAKFCFQGEITMNKIPFEKEYSNAAALAAYAAGAKYSWYVEITNAERDEYGPFRRLRVVNKSKTNDILIVLNHDSNKAYRLGPGEIANINGLLFSFVTIENTNTASAIAIGDVKVRVANFE